MRLTLLYCAAHSSSRRLLRVSPAITSSCMLGAVIAHHQVFFYYYYLPPSPWSKHFPTLANFSRRVLICNSLGCFLRLRALLSRMHNLHRRVRVCAHENPKASQRGLPASQRHCYLILTYCSYWILCPHAPLPSGTRSRRTKMLLLFTRRLITTDCAASLHCRHRCPPPPNLPGG